MVEVFAGALFAWWFSASAVLVYSVLTALVISIRWVTLTSLSYDVIEDEERARGPSTYALLFDREVFLNLGRMTGLGLFVLLFLIQPQAAIRYSLVCTALLQGLAFKVARQLNRSFETVT